jgi:hypothetical protein
MSNLFPHVFTAYAEIQKMKTKFPNDQEFGREVRKYLNDLKEGTLLNYSHVELDGTKIGPGVHGGC